MAEYTTDDGVRVTETDEVYDYYSMEPVVIGQDYGDGWFQSLRPDGKVSHAGMLNGQRICTLQLAKRRGFPGV